MKKPETIHRFMQENNIPAKILELDNNKPVIQVNGKSKARKDTVKKNEKIHFFIKDETRDASVKAEDLNLSVLYEDPYMLIVSKPEGMQMMISKAHKTGTLANALNFYYEQNDIRSKIHFVTKLDREASGLIVVAKHRFVKFLLSDQNSSAITTYLKAIVKGKLDLKESCIPLPITRVEGSVKREISEEGLECATNYRVIKEYGDFSLVDIWVTNKLAHQIRVHFSFFFCPIVGDDLYGEATDKKLMLYCYKMDFDHPITEEHVHVELIEPDYFKAYLQGK
ncbi:MAG: RluA family pseudouridine synthase [Bacilli bacterium]|nr:RluA family pseudouridine synthase [Bacilli bacterium]